MALDATVGGASSNSYSTLAEADAYFADRPNAADWDALGSAQSVWLIAATERLEQLAFQGRRTDDDQALAWPRYGVVVDDVEFDDDVIPDGVKRAQWKLALLLSTQEDPLADTGLEGFIRLKVDVIELVPRHEISAGDLPAEIRREIAPFTSGGSIHQFEIARG